MRRPWPEGARCLPVQGAAPGVRGSETGGGDSTPGSGGGQSPRHHHAESQARKRESTLPQADTDTGRAGAGTSHVGAAPWEGRQSQRHRRLLGLETGGRASEPTGHGASSPSPVQ